MNYIFFVPGIPAPGGSKRHIGRGRIIEDCKRTPAWRQAVAFAAMEARCQPLEGPLTLTVYFAMPRPRGHFNKAGKLKPSAPMYPTVRPDCTKLLRSTEDALLGICWNDDAQIVTQTVRKIYATGPAGAQIEVRKA